jgi:uncharacterized protein YraI
MPPFFPAEVTQRLGRRPPEGSNRIASKAMRLTPQILGREVLGYAVCLGVLLGATATAAVAKPAYVPTTVNLRAAPGIKSEVVAKIPTGSLIDADNCTEGWCAVTWEGKSGFAKQTALDMSGRVPQQRSAQARPRGPQRPVYVDEPEYYRPFYRSGWRHRW